jgi:hypothetical protein
MVLQIATAGFRRFQLTLLAFCTAKYLYFSKATATALRVLRTKPACALLTPLWLARWLLAASSNYLYCSAWNLCWGIIKASISLLIKFLHLLYHRLIVYLHI